MSYRHTFHVNPKHLTILNHDILRMSIAMHKSVTFRKGFENQVQELAFFFSQVLGSSFYLLAVRILGTAVHRIVGMYRVEQINLLDVFFGQFFHAARVLLDILAQGTALDDFVHHAFFAFATIHHIERNGSRHTQEESFLGLSQFLFQSFVCIRIEVHLYNLVLAYTVYGSVTTGTNLFTLAQVNLAQCLGHLDNFRESGHFKHLVNSRTHILQLEILLALYQLKYDTKTARCNIFQSRCIDHHACMRIFGANGIQFCFKLARCFRIESSVQRYCKDFIVQFITILHVT